MREMKEALKRVGVLALSVMLVVGSSNLTSIAAEVGANAAAPAETAAPAAPAVDPVATEPAAAPETPAAEQPAGTGEAGAGTPGAETPGAAEPEATNPAVTEPVAADPAADPAAVTDPAAETGEETAEESEEEEAESEEEEKDEEEASSAFSETAEIDGVTISVTAAEGVFPEGATLSVSKAEAAAEAAAENAVDGVRSDDKNVAASYTYDIKVLDKDGNEIQPADSNKVKISFTLSKVADSNLSTDIYHIKESTAPNVSAGASSASVPGSAGAEALSVSESGSTATAETDGFSLYTVEFTYTDKQYVIPGDSEVALADILEAVGLSGEVSAVSVSDDTLFSASQNEGGQWIVTAHKAFSTEEWMKVTINGTEYEITVTDDQVPAVKIGDTEYVTIPDAINAATTGDTIVVLRDVTISAPLEIPSGKTVTLDLNGHTIDRGLGVSDDGAANGNVITVNGNLTLKDSGTNGTIEGGSAISGGGVHVKGEGHFTMQGGTITHCSAHYGGGVFVSADGYFTMQGGSITGCILANSSGKGGGVFIKSDGTFYVSDAPVINSNNQSSNNVFLDTPEKIKIIGALSPSAQIYVNAGSGTTVATAGNNYALQASDAAAFHSDSSEDLAGVLNNNNIEIGSAWSSLQSMLETGGTVTLIRDYTAGSSDSALVVPTGKTVTLDLNGHTIDRGLGNSNEGVANGNVITVNGNLTLKDSGTNGKITGGNHFNRNDGYGGGVIVNGTFTMEGGKITGCKSLSNGGGVYVASGGTFTMTGGTITGCVASNLGGGVYTKGTFNVSGAPVIRNNTYQVPSTGDVGYGDVEIDNNDKMINITGVLTSGAEIRVNINLMYPDDPFARGTNNYHITESDAAKFVCNDESYAPILINTDNVIKMAQAYTITVATGIQNGTVTAPTRAAEGAAVILTVTPNEGYDVGSVSYNDGSDHVITPDSSGNYIFTMPANNVTVNATFAQPVAQVGNVKYTTVQGAINAAPANGTVTLLSDVNINTSLTIESGKIVTLDLNDHTIDRGLAGETAVRNGYVIMVNGNLTLKDSGTNGKITGGNNENGTGGGVYVNSGTFTMQGGTISENHSAGPGGGVYVDGGTFNMTGGTITDNNATSVGGGVCVGDNGTFNVSGTPVISGNFTDGIWDYDHYTLNEESSNSAMDDVALAYSNGGEKSYITVSGELTSGASIYVNRDVVGRPDTAIVGADNYTIKESDVGYFHCCDDNYVAVLRNGGIKFEQAYAISVDAYMHNGTIETSSTTAVAGATVTLTITPDSGYVLETLTVMDDNYNSINVSGTGNTRTFTMPADNVTVGASFAEAKAQVGDVKYSTVQGAIDAAPANGTVTLLSDVSINTSLTIASGKTVTLDLNDHTIDRGLANEELVENGNVITVNGTLTLTDNSTNKSGELTGGNGGVGSGVLVRGGTFNMQGGTITGCEAKSCASGGGVCVDNNGTFTMEGNSSITACTADGNGGGVYVYNGTFNMKGGSIIDCRANGNGGAGGGGVYVQDGTFTMTGGSITNNYVTGDNRYGGGVYSISSTFNISGAPVISGNTKGNGVSNNFIVDGYDIINVTGTLTGDANIYVTAYDAGVIAQVSGSRTTALNETELGYFHSDVSTYTPAMSSDRTKVVFKTPASVSVAPAGSSSLTYDGSDQTLVTAATVTGGTAKYALTSSDGTTEPSGLSYSTSIPTETNAGDYYIWYYVEGDNYHSDSEHVRLEQPVTIAKKPATVTASAQSVEVNGTISQDVSKATLTGAVSSHTLNGVTLTSSSTSDITEQGTITPSDAVIKDASGNDVTSNYDITYTAGTLAVTSTQVYISGITAVSREYNGNTNVTFSGTPVIKAVRDDAVVTGLGAESIEAAFADANAGNNKTVTISSATLTGEGAGNYTLNIEKTNETLNLKANITKVPITVGASIEGWTYGGTASTPVVNGNTGNGTVTYEYKVQGAADSTYTTTVPVNHGDYTLRATVAATDNYQGGSATADFSIAKANATLSQAPAAVADLSYTGSLQELVTAGTATGGTIQYKLGASGTYGTSVPKARDAGDYTVYYKVAGDQNHNDIAETSVAVSIAQQTTSITTTPVSKHYGDSAFAITGVTNNVGATPTYAVTAGTNVISISGSTVTILKPGSATITASIPVSTNYTAATATIAVTVANGAQPAQPAATMTTAYANDTVSKVSLPTGWTWAADDRATALTVGTAVTANAEYTADDAAYYDGGKALEIAITRQAQPSSSSGSSGTSSTPAATVTPSAPAATAAATTTTTADLSSLVFTPVAGAAAATANTVAAANRDAGNDTAVAGSRTESSQPHLEGHEGVSSWNDIADVIKESSDPAAEEKTLTIEIDRNAKIPAAVFEAAKGSDVTLVFDMGDGITWSVKGTDITDGAAASMDFGVTRDSHNIPNEVAGTLVGDHFSTQISLDFDGPFGFTATLTMDMGSENAGKIANLFYFNPDTNNLEFIYAGEIGENGSADLEFTHASDYLIVVADESMETAVLDTSAGNTETPAGGAEVATEAPEKGWNPVWIILLVGVVIIVGIGMMMVKNKEEK